MVFTFCVTWLRFITINVHVKTVRDVQNFIMCFQNKESSNL